MLPTQSISWLKRLKQCCQIGIQCSKSELPNTKLSNLDFFNLEETKSVEKPEIHCHANFFPSNQFVVKFVSKTLIWRNFCEKTVAVKLRHFHSVDTHYAEPLNLVSVEKNFVKTIHSVIHYCMNWFHVFFQGICEIE